jgi:DNA (cytosine-5)-methyltransferase 1
VDYFPRTRSCGRPKLTCIDLFSGAGGLAAGFRDAGFSILAGSDIDPDAATTFRKNFPEASFFLGDIAHLRAVDLMRDGQFKRGELDCLIGGPPCQAFSYNNHQRSIAHVRAGLFREYLRILHTLRPKTLVMENVPGILTIGNGAILEEIYEALKELGYNCRAKILYSEDFGSPQQRRRVFFIATKRAWNDDLFPSGICQPAPKPKSNLFVHHWTPVEPKDRYLNVNVWSAIGDLPPLRNGAKHDQPKPYRSAPQTWLQSHLRARQQLVRNHDAPVIGSKMVERIRHVPQGGNWRDIPRRLLPAGMKRAHRSDHTRRYGRLRRTGMCCTILTKCDPHWGSYIHPTSDRVITVREAARLQTFKDNFHFTGNLSSQYAQVGNAVPPLVAQAVAEAIMDHLES